MTLNQLRYVVMVAQTGSITQAAKRLIKVLLCLEKEKHS